MKEILNPKKAYIENYHAEKLTLIFGSALLLVAILAIYVGSRVEVLAFYVVPVLYVLLVAAFYALASFRERLAAGLYHTPDKHYLNAILNSSQEMVWAVDLQYRLVAFNEAFRSSIMLFSGHNCSIGDNVLNINFGEAAQRWKHHYDKALRGMSFTFRDDLPGVGHTIWFENTIQPLRLGDVGKIVGVSCFSKDITSKVDQEEQLAESNRRLSTALEVGEIGFWEYNQLSDRVELSANMYEMLGYAPAQAKQASHSWQALIHPDDLQATIANFHRQMNSQSGQVMLTYRVLGKNGDTFWMNAKGSAVERDSSGKVLRAIGTQHNITSQKLYEEQLKRLSLVASKTHNGVVILNSDARVEWANDAYETVTGFHLARIKGKSHIDYLFAPETSAHTIRRIREGLLFRSIVREEVQCVRPSGDKIWLLLEITPIFDDNGNLEHFVSIETDITEKKQKEQQRMLLESAVKHVAEAVLIVSKSPDQQARDFKVVYANDAFFRITGYSESEVMGRSPVKLLKGPKTESAKLARIFEAVSNESYLEDEVVSYRKSGEAFWVRLALSPVGGLHDDQNHFFVAIVRDINDRKTAQAEKQSLTQELVNRNKELQEFTQVVSHNLRAPVANILGLANIFDRSQALGDYNQTILRHLVEAASRLDTILIDLNDILQVRENALALKQRFKLRDMVDQVLGSFMLQTDELKASIEVDVAPNDLEVQSVRGYFHSVIHNLVSNGIKYRHPDRVPKLRINAYTTSSDLVMVFTDNGLGMDMQQVGEKMFMLYKRFHAHVEGKGMGLFLVKTQVERIGGTISVRSVVGKGSAFRVTVPLERCRPQAAEANSAESI